MTAAAPALDVRDLTYRVDGTTILHGVSLRVEAGRYVSIVGPNGAGKSTFLKCLNRILLAAGGEIQVHGRPLAAYSQPKLAREIGYVPQGGTDDIPFTVFEFAMLGRYPHLSPFTPTTEADEEAVRNALAMAGASELAERPCYTLSGGERQRVLIARALVSEPRLLLLDEPTTFLDPHHQQDILKLLARLHRETNVTILSVTHDINAAAMTSDEILALRDGRAVFHGPPADLMQEKVLLDLFDQSFLFVPHPKTGQRLVIPEDAQ
ncbi:MAG: ABC transporter ATP-binding protein [Victivallales bacterium]|nr:ABC transporter ATP-binding protein [Victivallales bacterium]